VLKQFIAFLIVPAALWAQETTNQALDRLAKNPKDHEAISQLKGQYLDHLVGMALIAIDSDAPYPLARDADGKDIRGQMDPAFAEWCRDHQREIASCASDYLYPGAVMQLAMLGPGIR
jgi:hypothetical protein